MDPAQIELRHLRYFPAVAETRSFTRAAERVHVSQPTLSHQVRQLEEQLGLVLFDRVAGRVGLTHAGEVLLPRARRVLAELENARRELGELHGLRRGLLRVGIMESVHASAIPEIVKRFAVAYPGVQLNCLELAVGEIEAGVEAGTLDLGIAFLPPGRPTLEGERLCTEELVAVAPADHPLARRKRLSVRELAASPLVLLAGGCYTGRMIHEAFRTAGVRPRVQVEMNSIRNILSTVREARLPTILPSMPLGERERDFRAIPLVAPHPHRDAGLLWLRGAHERVSAEAFARLVRAVFEPLTLRGASAMPSTATPAVARPAEKAASWARGKAG